MARRIALAQALINDPDLLLLDEPTTGLDPIGTKQIKDLIIELAKRGKTILLSSHLLADVEDVCDRIAILYGGKIRSEGKVKELLQQTNKMQITTGVISENAVEKIKQIARDENTDCLVTSPMDKLETFFIRTVTTAQQLSVPTSGAVSTTQIGHFLAPQISPESILDKLVSTPESQDVPQKPPVTTQVVSPETREPKPDEQLLGKLTEQVKPTEKTVIKTEETKHKTPQKEQINKNILDQLTDHPSTQNTAKKHPDKSQTGDSGDA